jgi:hypothetical protein
MNVVKSELVVVEQPTLTKAIAAALAAAPEQKELTPEELLKLSLPYRRHSSEKEGEQCESLPE